APFPNISEPCLLWQLDSDELWSSRQISKMRRAFLLHPEKTGAEFYCHYLVGPRKYVTSINTWAGRAHDWMRVWKYSPKMRWQSHEPPVLIDSKGHDLMQIRPFTRDETRSMGLVFQHHGYVVEPQVRFKEIYYGLSNAVKGWHDLQMSRGEVRLENYLPWTENAKADDWPKNKKILFPVPEPAVLNRPLTKKSRKNPVKVICVSSGKIVDHSLLNFLTKKWPKIKLTIVCPQEEAKYYFHSPWENNTCSYNGQKLLYQPEYRNRFLHELQDRQADYCVNSVYPRNIFSDFLALGSRAKSIIGFDMKGARVENEIVQKNSRFYPCLITGDFSPSPRESVRSKLIETLESFLSGKKNSADSLYIKKGHLKGPENLDKLLFTDAQYYLIKAETAFKENRIKESLSFYKKLVSQKNVPPSLAQRAYLYLGHISRDLNDQSWAAYYQKAIELLVRNKNASVEDIYQTGSLYKKIGQHDQAQIWFVKTLLKTRDPLIRAGVYFHLGEMALQLDRRNNALSYFKKCRRLNPGHQKAGEYLSNLSLDRLNPIFPTKTK
ncbi:MAG: tetratricopeptide repeat protein, partial [Candidatus Aureabacteria bacterium]|nr:tetratricopeptide repeat protein [Candidatus Auribacterota bacterium]